MTEAERQQVIDALENSVPKPMDGDDDYCEGGWKRHREARAIMRREDRATQAGDIPDFGHPVREACRATA